jgi:predicted metal-binding membrane protein
MSAELLFGVLRHDRAIVLGALAAVIAAAWAYLLLGAGIEMEMMDMGGGQMMAMLPEWTPAYAALIFTMWLVMMAAMMLPSAAPTILLVGALTCNRCGRAGSVPATSLIFALGYLLVWAGFSLVATLLQWGLDEAGLLSETMALANAALASGVLIAAGIYQWSPLKDTCLKHCRSPADFLVRHWRRGPIGALRTGMRHGLFCLGCCWMLMALLFVGGLMSLAWIAAIALVVLFEKTMPWGGRMSRLTGGVLAIWGVVNLARVIL